MSSAHTREDAAVAVDERATDTEFTDRFVRPWDDDQGTLAFLDDRTDGRYELYGHGKVALRDALGLLAVHTSGEKTNVVLPAYVPSALLEPIREAGYSPRFHRITRSLRPDLSDVERQLDDRSLALLSVNYFGLPQPDHTILRELADDVGAALIEDNAHSTLSMTPDGTLLGTRGDLGFTSFRKTLPVPDGAALFVTHDRFRTGPFPRAGVRTGFTRHDAKYLLAQAARRLPLPDPFPPRDRSTPSHRDVLHGGRDLYGRDPRAIYERSKGPMSRLTPIALGYLRPESIIADRRRRYRAHLHTLESLREATPVFGRLPTGTCPQGFPLLVHDWQPVSERLAAEGIPFSRWPPLPFEVAMDDRFITSHHLADRLLVLPV